MSLAAAELRRGDGGRPRGTGGGTGRRRRLVLNQLTAEATLHAIDNVQEVSVSVECGGSRDSLEFYHELELYRQLLALPPAPPPAPPRPAESVSRRARTPDPPKCRHDEPVRRSRTPGARSRSPPVTPAAAPPPPLTGASHAPAFEHTRHAEYLGSFPVGEGELDARESISEQLQVIKESGRAEPVVVVIALSGVKVCDPGDQSVRMSHALRRISFATCEGARALFAFVARQRSGHEQHCHAFHTTTPQQAEELNSLVGDAFRMAFASQLQPSAPIWGKELNAECGGMGVRAPDSLPGLNHHYPHCLDRSPTECDIMGMRKLVNEASPTSSEESNSPTEVLCYRRLGERLAERPPLMKRLALGISGALMHPSDDDSTPLVTDTPTTPTNLPLCMNGGYINEASEAEARTRESNRDTSTTRNHTLDDTTDDQFNKTCNNMHNGSSGSVSCSGASSSSRGSTRANNNPRREPELIHAPWFQAGIPREIALEVLSNEPVGSFLVRGSTTQAGCLALSVRVPRDFAQHGIAHYLILHTGKGYKIKGFTKEFSCLSALVTHHSVMPELLPCALLLPRPTPAPRAPHSAPRAAAALASRHHTPRRDL